MKNVVLIMIFLMSAAVVIHVMITAFIWRLWLKKDSHTLSMKIAVGILYGFCSILSTHIGVNYSGMILNVRDLSPLAAGLFFDPVSGVIAGLMGGIERYYAGTYMHIGYLTTTACSISTCLAGILGALLNVYIYRGKTPPVIHTLFTGAVMEVFHMYTVLLTNRSNMSMAYYVVRQCSVPMIIFNGIGLMLCCLAVREFKFDKIRNFFSYKPEKIPLNTRFHISLLLITLIVFSVNNLIDYDFHQRTAYQEAENYLIRVSSDCEQLYKELDEDEELTRSILPFISIAMDDSAGYLLFNKNKDILSCSNMEQKESLRLPDSDFKEFTSHTDEEVYRYTITFYEGLDSLCITKKLGDNHFLVVVWLYDKVRNSQIDQSYETLLSAILLFTVLYVMISVLVDKLVVKNLSSVNSSLQRIISGNLDEVVNVRSSSEFSLLSDDINQTVTTLKGYIAESEKRMAQELQMASFIQEAALPHNFNFPRSDFEIYALMKPARYVAGDFYDFFFIDVNRLALVIADVAGKGIPAAMFMMRAKTAIKNAARSDKSVAEIISEVNNALSVDNDAEMFVTVWLGIIDLDTGLMKCSNAGHEYPVICRADGDYEIFKDKHSLVMGAMLDAPRSEYDLQFKPGDRLFVYTDGVPEAINTSEEQYGLTRLTDALNSLKTSSQEDTLIKTHHDIVKFVGDAEQFDDITMLGFKYIGS